MPDGAALYRLDHLIRHAKHRAMTEAGHDRAAAVDTGERLVLVVAAKLHCLFNDRGKVLILADVRQFWVGYHRRGEHAVGVACFRRHQAVGGKQHRRGDVGKLLLLVLPRRAEVALEMGVLFQLRIAVGRQHFTVGVDVDAFTLGLLQQQFQIVEIVAGDDDERPLLHRQRDGGRRGRTVAFGVGLIQKRHALEVFLAHLHHDGQQRVHIPVLAHSKKSLGEKAVHFLVGITQHHSVMGVSRHAAHAEEDQGFEAANILLRVPEQVHIIIIVSPAAGAAAGAAWNKAGLFLVYPIDQLPNGLFVEAHIGDGGEQALDHQPPSPLIRIRGIIYRTGQSNQSTSQLILKLRHLSGFAADAGFSGTTGAASRLLTLKAKHPAIHCRSSPSAF